MSTCFGRVRDAGGVCTVVVEHDAVYRVDGDMFGTWRRGAPMSPEGLRWLAPVTPGKIIGIGRNYRDHAAERGKPIPEFPLVFLKPPSSVVGPDEPIVLPAGVGRVDYEAELAIVIGQRVSKVARAGAAQAIFGATCVNDVTARGLQDAGVQFSHAKGFDTFAPMGPYVVTALDLDDVTVEGFVNGERRQSSSTRSLIFPVDELVSFVSHIMTLEPGDIIMTGTPAGVGPLSAGDSVAVRVGGVGTLTNPVTAGEPS